MSLGCPGLSADCAALNLLSQTVGNAWSALHSPWKLASLGDSLPALIISPLHLFTKWLFLCAAGTGTGGAADLCALLFCRQLSLLLLSPAPHTNSSAGNHSQKSHEIIVVFFFNITPLRFNLSEFLILHLPGIARNHYNNICGKIEKKPNNRISFKGCFQKASFFWGILLQVISVSQLVANKMTILMRFV